MLIRHCLYRETSERNVTSETVEPLMGHSSEVSFLGQYSHIRHHRGAKFACLYSFFSHFLFARGGESKMPYPNGIRVYSGSPWAPSDFISTPTQVLINTQKQHIWLRPSKDHFWWPVQSILHYTAEEPALWATSLFSSLFSLTLISKEWFFNALEKSKLGLSQQRLMSWTWPPPPKKSRKKISLKTVQDKIPQKQQNSKQ